MSLDYMNPLVHDRFNHVLRIMNHCVLIGLHSDEQNHVHMVPESIQYCE